MTKEIIPQALNSVWATDTPNKININDDETNQGIIYQSLVVSNQMNGALYKMSQALRAHQLSGGYWTAGQRYYKGQIVKASIIEDVRFRPTLRYFECIDDDNGNGIVDVPLYRPLQGFTDGGGVRTYTALPKDLNTTNWRMLNGNEAMLEEMLKTWVQNKLDEMKAYVDTEVLKLRNDTNKLLKDFETKINKQIADQQKWVNERVNAITDKWKDLGTVNGGTYNFSFAGANNDFNCFRIALAGSVNFGTCTWTGAKERSGCFLIQTGAAGLKQFFTNVYSSFSLNPWYPVPRNSGTANTIWLFYKVHPTYGVCFTRG